MTLNSPLPTPDSRLLQTEIGSPPASETATGRQGLPEDLLRQSSRRLGIVCLAIADLWAANDPDGAETTLTL